MQIMRKISVVMLVVLANAACQKVNPQIDFLSRSIKADPEKAPNGRVTLGSAITTNGTYRLKGRISMIEPAESASGPYKLKGSIVR